MWISNHKFRSIYKHHHHLKYPPPRLQFRLPIMDCLVSPAVSMLRRCCSGSRLRYGLLPKDDSDGWDGEGPVTVVVGKEKREFLVEPYVLEKHPFRSLIGAAGVEGRRTRRVIFVGVDAILFEHMLWLMHNDWSSLSRLDLDDIIDFYAQDC
ncbi:uncharacterized protein LOC127813449 [Diospyros lotus]|uniref:uncharacterized protein LOC127813449 n=1 Tax=Diospyros lotus TaxID=55363 RepID=UPI00224FF7D5|nr:uncharacterized protein LOC127813449 [Diospyros lotus]